MVHIEAVLVAQLDVNQPDARAHFRTMGIPRPSRCLIDAWLRAAELGQQLAEVEEPATAKAENPVAAADTIGGSDGKSLSQAGRPSPAPRQIASRTDSARARRPYGAIEAAQTRTAPHHRQLVSGSSRNDGGWHDVENSARNERPKSRLERNALTL